jgi:hypothetical protein
MKNKTYSFKVHRQAGGRGEMKNKTYSFKEAIRHDHFTHPKPPELKVELARGQKGSYGWTISYNGKDADEIISKIREVDAKLREAFLQEESK